MVIKQTSLIDITPFVGQPLVKNDYIDIKNNFCRFKDLSLTQANLYGAILGCRMDREPNEIKTESLSSRFVSKEKAK